MGDHDDEPAVVFNGAYLGRRLGVLVEAIPNEVARRMGASRSTVERFPDMDDPSVTLLTLGRSR